MHDSVTTAGVSSRVRSYGVTVMNIRAKILGGARSSREPVLAAKKTPKGIKVDSPDQVGPAWDRALAADRPVLIEAVTDPEVPPLPPHIRFDQAKEMAVAMSKGDPNRGHIIRESLKGKLAEFVNR